VLVRWRTRLQKVDSCFLDDLIFQKKWSEDVLELLLVSSFARQAMPQGEALFEEVMVVVVRVLVFPVLIVVSSFPFVSNVFHKTG